MTKSNIDVSAIDVEEPATSLRVLKLNVVLDRVSVSKSGLYNMIRAREFPPPIRLYGRAVGWRSDVVDSWIRSRQIAQSFEKV